MDLAADGRLDHPVLDLSAPVHLAGRYKADAAALEWRDWGDEWVVYDSCQARTHLLSAEAGEMLRLMIDRSCTVDELASALFDDAGTVESTLTPDERASIGRILDDLGRLGLVEMMPS